MSTLWDDVPPPMTVSAFRREADDNGNGDALVGTEIIESGGEFILLHANGREIARSQDKGLLEDYRDQKTSSVRKTAVFCDLCDGTGNQWSEGRNQTVVGSQVTGSKTAAKPKGNRAPEEPVQQSMRPERQIRISPSADQLKARKQQARKQSSNKESAMRTEAQILREMAVASLADQRTLAAELDGVRHSKAASRQQERDVDLADTIVRAHLTPVRVHAMHTTATDWVDTEEPQGDPTLAMKTEATLWFQRTSAEVREDLEEFAIQAQGKATQLASREGEMADMAFTAFIDHVDHLYRQASKVAVGDQITCPTCKGEGVDPTNGKSCGECNGTGKVDDDTKEASLRTALEDYSAEMGEVLDPDEYDQWLKDNPGAPKLSSRRTARDDSDSVATKCDGCGDDDANNAGGTCSKCGGTYKTASRRTALDADPTGQARSGLPTVDNDDTAFDDPGFLNDDDDAGVHPPMPGAGEKTSRRRLASADECPACEGPRTGKCPERSDGEHPTDEEYEVEQHESGNTDYKTSAKTAMSDTDYDRGYQDALDGKDMDGATDEYYDGYDDGLTEKYSGQKAARRIQREAAEGGSTCSSCGASIERDPEGEEPRTWHHNDGASHDHEATPSSDSKESSKIAAEDADGWGPCEVCGAKAEVLKASRGEGSRYFCRAHEDQMWEPKKAAKTASPVTIDPNRDNSGDPATGQSSLDDTEVGDEDDKPKWPWELDKNKPGTGAADVKNAKNPNDHTSMLDKAAAFRAVVQANLAKD